MDVILGEDGKRAHQEMQTGLLRSFFALTTVASAGLLLRELVVGGPVLAAVLATIAGATAWFWSTRKGAPVRTLGIGLCVALVFLIAKAALDLGGAAGPALSFSFIPGLLSMLVLGPSWGVSITALMLGVNGWLFLTTPLPSLYDRLRFEDQVLVTLFASGLSLALSRSLLAYEKSIAERKEALLSATERRTSITSAVYEELEPCTLELIDALHNHSRAPDRTHLQNILQRMSDSLTASQALAKRSPAELFHWLDRDATIRCQVMRVWLRIGAVFMALIVVRNLLSGQAFVASLFSLAFCILLDLWLARRRPDGSLEWVAFAIALLATGPLVVHIEQYGATAEAPALVVAPSIVLFSALLSQGAATWAVVVIQLCILLWVGIGEPLTLRQGRLLGDLALGFVVVAVSLHQVFQLRRRYAEELRAQGLALVEDERRHRRLSGTLFHDVRNHLQALMFYVDPHNGYCIDDHVSSLSKRIARLVSLSKDLLLNTAPNQSPRLEAVSLKGTVRSLTEAYGPRLKEKDLRFVAESGLDLQVLAVPDLLVDSVFGNLLSNAIKFSPPGASIELFAQMEGDRVRISLIDEGQGVPKEVLQQLGLGSEAALPSQPGTGGEQGQGYGLQLVQEHLERMAGRMSLQTRSPRGTEAMVWLKAV